MSATEADLDLIRHMTGAAPHKKKSSWGYRNYFAAGIGGENEKALDQMATDVLVSRGQRTEQMQYFHATRDGCNAIGLTKAQIARVFAP